MFNDFYCFGKEIGKYELLTTEEENTLIEKAYKGDKAAQEKLVLSNLRYAFKIAKENVNKGVPFMDLFQAACIGLIKASKKVNPKFNNRFITYATWSINYEIDLELCETGKSVKVPVKNYEQRFNPEWDFDSLDREITNSSGDSASLGSFLQDNSLVNPEDIFLRKEQMEMLDNALDQLSEIERTVVLEHSGLNCESKSYSNIGKEIGYTKQGTNAINNRAFEKIKAYLAENYDFDFSCIAA